MKNTALAFLRFCPYFTVVALHDFFADSQPDARAGVLLFIQAVKEEEDFVQILFIDADAIILEGELIAAALFLIIDMDDCLFFIVEFQAIQ